MPMTLEKPTYPLEYRTRYQVTLTDGRIINGALEVIKGPVFVFTECYHHDLMPASELSTLVVHVAQVKQLRRLLQ